MITTTVIHHQTELGEPGNAELVIFHNGERISSAPFAVQRPTGAEIAAKRQALAFDLYYCKHPAFDGARSDLYRAAFPWGE